ncbi:MAG: DOMON-like domain-containing protein [Desulfobacterales bacterium]|nr:DOMON-like domain-containing protein [Desulfobacterales bacterium]
MEQKTIRLQPFQVQAAVELDITCTIGRQSHLLKVDFRLQGDLKAVAIPTPARRPARHHQLWENTCLECFVSAEGSQAYWEFNLSPSGDWNLYRFDDYRRDMREEPAIPELILNMQKEPNLLCLGCMIDLGGLGLDRQTLDMGVAAVVRSSDGRNTYHAAAHPGPKPDFHHREAFILKVSP